jgi:hypothetical protein
MSKKLVMSANGRISELTLDEGTEFRPVTGGIIVAEGYVPGYKGIHGISLNVSNLEWWTVVDDHDKEANTPSPAE